MASNHSITSGPRGGLHDRLFAHHPRSLGMTWAGHGIGAARIGMVLIGAGIACVIHALVPGWFTHTAGKTVNDIHGEMQRRKAGSGNPENWSDYDI